MIQPVLLTGYSMDFGVKLRVGRNGFDTHWSLLGTEANLMKTGTQICSTEREGELLYYSKLIVSFLP